MADYIDRQKLLKDIEQYHLSDGKFQHWVEVQPSADVQLVRHGNWIGIDDEPCETFECDRCGFVLEDWIQGAFYNFCPNCGARMDGEQGG